MRCQNEGFTMRSLFLVEAASLSVLGGQRMPTSQASTLLINQDPEWGVKTKCLKWGPFLCWRQPVCFAGQKCRFHQEAKKAGFTGGHVACNWGPKWDATTRSLFVGGRLSVLPVSQSVHVSLFLNEMLKRSVENEIPFLGFAMID
jgi:hypothetical protein